MKIQVIYEDEEIIVCIKPAGLLSQGDKAGSRDMVRELKNYLVLKARKDNVTLRKEPYIAVLHRLDRNVRGIMVYAKDKKAAAAISKQIRENKLDKKYLAVVTFDSNKISPELNVWKKRTDYIIFDKLKNRSEISDEKGAEKAELAYRILKIAGNRALAEINLITGRHHQIRLQMSAIFNGIAGDTKYNPDYSEGKGWQELALEAVGLSFMHPSEGKKMEFSIRAEGKDFGELNAENYL